MAKNPISTAPLTFVEIVMRADAETIKAAYEARLKVDALLQEREEAYRRCERYRPDGAPYLRDSMKLCLLFVKGIKRVDDVVLRRALDLLSTLLVVPLLFCLKIDQRLLQL